MNAEADFDVLDKVGVGEGETVCIALLLGTQEADIAETKGVDTADDFVESRTVRVAIT